MTSSRKIKRPKSLTQLAIDNIRDGITSGTYALGSPLYEKVLAEEFGISKTPVREALVQLQREGLVVVQPYSGTFVFELEDGEVGELCEMRLILETNGVQLSMHRRAARLTAELDELVGAMAEAVAKEQVSQYRELDARFHEAFFKYCGNGYLARSAAVIEAKLKTLRVSVTMFKPDVQALSLTEHQKIAAALRESRLDAAIEILTAHIKRARDLMRGLHEANPITVEKFTD
jgi:DNA-binding GntR family transcriptional regulator